MPTIREALRGAADRFRAAGVPDAANDAALLLSHVTGEPQLNLRADAGRELSADVTAAFEALVNRRAAREPLQYITGEAWFESDHIQLLFDEPLPVPGMEEYMTLYRSNI